MTGGINLTAPSGRSASGTRDEAFRRNVVGVFAETVPVGAAQTAATTTSGRVVAAPVYLFAGEVVTNIIIGVVTAGSGLTLVRLGLYSGTTQLATTADVKAAYTGTGRIINALSSPYTITADGVYYLAYIATNSAGSQPTIAMSQTNNSTIFPSITGGVNLAVQQAGQTDLQSPATWSTGTGQLLYMAVS